MHYDGSREVNPKPFKAKLSPIFLVPKIMTVLVFDICKVDDFEFEVTLKIKSLLKAL